MPSAANQAVATRGIVIMENNQLQPSMPEQGATAAPPFVAYTAVPQVEAPLEQHLGANAPFKLPAQHQETFVKLLPWITVVFMPFHFAAVLLLFGVSALASLVGHFGWTGALLSAATLACDVIALPGLFKRTRQGWAFFVYAQAIGVVGKLFSFSLFGLHTSLVLLWLSFQVKYKYS